MPKTFDSMLNRKSVTVTGIRKSLQPYSGISWEQHCFDHPKITLWWRWAAQEHNTVGGWLLVTSNVPKFGQWRGWLRSYVHQEERDSLHGNKMQDNLQVQWSSPPNRGQWNSHRGHEVDNGRCCCVWIVHLWWMGRVVPACDHCVLNIFAINLGLILFCVDFAYVGHHSSELVPPKYHLSSVS